jgi:hypothetical protein
MTYDASQSKTLLAGLSFDLTSAFRVDVTGIASQRSGIPLGFTRDNGLTPNPPPPRWIFPRIWISAAAGSPPHPSARA